MRKQHLENVNKYIELLKKLQEAIVLEIAASPENAVKHLEMAQNKAIELGTYIEKLMGEGFVTVGYLEEYCEVLYQICTGTITNENVALQLANSLGKVINSIENDISVKKEVVFLPYKASMWDSLESVWKKYEADPEWDAYVIPIPYFDRDENKNIIAEHYEANEYPKDVPVVSYEKYDFGIHHPDRIYIHNPYDDCNFVTTIHPFFYSDKLKNLCDELIYIPYFVLAEPDVSNDDQLENLKYFFVNPCMLNITKAIVQSENMRQAYIKILNKELPVRKWEDIIDGSGSPKIEKVKSMSRKDVEIPEDWLKIIKKPDGSWKKIIFYNTTVTAIINNEETYLPKMRNTLAIFKANQDKVALLWRPHPLMEATLKSMEPQMYQEYMDIVNQYRTEGWGIYDDTADMDRAVVLSDGYYGDGSSVVQLCQEREIPVMIQSMDVLGDVE